MGSGACSLDPFLRTLPSKQSKLLLFAVYILIMVSTELCMLMQSFVLLYDIFMGITSKIFCSGYGLLFLQYLNTSTIICDYLYQRLEEEADYFISMCNA